MTHLNLRGTKVQFIDLPVMILRQGKRFIAYSPALDLSTSGKNLKEVQKRFTEAVDLFFSELIEQATVEEVLEDLGWERVQKEWLPPTVVSSSDHIEIRIPAGV